MANWDEEQLADVVEKKHGEDNRKKNATQIVSFIPEYQYQITITSILLPI